MEYKSRTYEKLVNEWRPLCVKSPYRKSLGCIYKCTLGILERCVPSVHTDNPKFPYCNLQTNLNSNGNPSHLDTKSKQISTNQSTKPGWEILWCSYNIWLSLKRGYGPKNRRSGTPTRRGCPPALSAGIRSQTNMMLRGLPRVSLTWVTWALCSHEGDTCFSLQTGSIGTFLISCERNVAGIISPPILMIGRGISSPPPRPPATLRVFP